MDYLDHLERKIELYTLAELIARLTNPQCHWDIDDIPELLIPIIEELTDRMDKLLNS